MDKCHWCWTWHLTRLSKRNSSLRIAIVDDEKEDEEEEEEEELLLLLDSTGGGVSSSSFDDKVADDWQFSSPSSMSDMITCSLQLNATRLGVFDGLILLIAKGSDPISNVKIADDGG